MYVMYVASTAIFLVKAFVGGSNPPLVFAPNSVMADHNRKGVQLASGQSVTVFKQILQNLGYNPVEAMENTINSERYDCITVEGK